MSALTMGETGRGQKPAVTPRRRMLRHADGHGAADLESSGEYTTIRNSKSTSDLHAGPARTKPARPDPPKFKPEALKKPMVKVGVTKPPPPPSDPASRELLQSALSRYYGNGFATAPSRTRRKRISSNDTTLSASTEVDRDVSKYVNVAPKSPPSTKYASKNKIGAAAATKSSPTSPIKRIEEKKKVSRPSPLKIGGRVQVSDSRDVGLAHKSASARLPKQQHHLHATQRQQLSASISMPLPSQTQETSPVGGRHDFAKQPLPKSPLTGHRRGERAWDDGGREIERGLRTQPVREGGRNHEVEGRSRGKVLPRQAPTRPAPPRPYIQKNKTNSESSAREIERENLTKEMSMNHLARETDSDHVAREIDSNIDSEHYERADEVVEEYTYVDPQKCRYQANIHSIDSSTQEELEETIYMNDSDNMKPGIPSSEVYTALSISTITEDVYTVPDATKSTSPEMVEANDREANRLMEMEGDGHGPAEGGHSIGVYANVAPKAPISRSKSFTLDTSSGPDSPSPTSRNPPGAQFSSPPHEGSPLEPKDGNIYTAITRDTMELPSIYEVPPTLK